MVKILMVVSARTEFCCMSNPARILIYGRDSSLLETRQLVLQTVGGIVDATTDFEHAKRLLIEERPDLLVLCYTLTSQDRAAILSAVQDTRPAVQVLVLRADGPPSTQTSEDEFSIFTGPGALKAKVIEMLGRREAVNQ
jgi:DNA-binding NtrC family response regulator